jgi:hypothetical protein
MSLGVWGVLVEAGDTAESLTGFPACRVTAHGAGTFQIITRGRSNNLDNTVLSFVMDRLVYSCSQKDSLKLIKTIEINLMFVSLWFQLSAYNLKLCKMNHKTDLPNKSQQQKRKQQLHHK